MTDEELQLFQRIGILVTALERIAESPQFKDTACAQIAKDALQQFHESE